MDDYSRKKVVEFLLESENQELLDDEDFDGLYRKCGDKCNVGELTKLLTELLNCNESELLEYLLCVPYRFLYNSKEIESITIPNNIASIGVQAFENCTSLKSVVIGNNVDSINLRAFYKCYALESINLPDSLASIDSSAFATCTSLTSITIPDSVKSIGSQAFYNCHSLKNVYYSDIASQWASISFGDAFSNPLVYAGNLYLNGTLATDITLEDVTTVNAYAFSNCSSLISVTIGNSVTSIGRGAFYNCKSLKSVAIPGSVTCIDQYAFDKCTSLKSMTYNGTKEQYMKATGEEMWCTVHCTDGDLIY